MMFSSFCSSIRLPLIVWFLAAILNSIRCHENCILASFDEICVPESQQLKFYLYTRETADSPFQLNLNNIKQAPFLPSTPMKVLIHGYTGSKDYSPNMELRPAYFKKDDYNLVSIDWGPLAVDGCYIEASNNVKPVGQCTARLLEKIVEVRKDVKPEDIHVIGFSLGGHVAGYVGKSLCTFKATRITGLDPALPGFPSIFNSALSVGKEDAKFVDVIHTNGGMYGKAIDIGHVDYHANDGSIQPGCPTTNKTCLHVRAVELFAESINSNVGFYGYKCPSIVQYIESCCSRIDSASEDEWVLLGEDVDNSLRGSYYFDTHDKYPWAMGKACKQP